MNRMQIALKLGMDFLGVPVNSENYRQICNLVYLCGCRGVHISPARILFDEERQIAYSPKSHESGGNPSRNLNDDICEIQLNVLAGYDKSQSWRLDEESLKRLEQLKRDVESQGVEELLRTCAVNSSAAP